MANRSKILTYTQQIEYIENFTNIKDYVNNLLVKLKEKYEKSEFKVSGILHDKDVYTEKEVIEQENLTRQDIGKPKPPHIHIVINSDNYMTLNGISELTKIPINNIELGKGQKSKQAFLCYLIHLFETNKYYYEPNEVIANFDYIAYIENIKSKLDINKARKEKNTIHQMKISELEKYKMLADINDLEIININDYIGKDIKRKMYYINNKKVVDNLIELNKYDALKKIIEIRKENFIENLNIQIIGNGGTGKTSLVNAVVQAVGIELQIDNFKKEYLELYKGTEKNPFDNIGIQLLMLLDDFRGDNMSVSTLLKVFDNYTNERDARYKNKQDITLIKFITSSQDIETIFKLKAKDKKMFENIDQIRRRFKIKIVALGNNQYDIYGTVGLKEPKKVIKDGYENEERYKELLVFEKVSKTDTIALLSNAIYIKLIELMNFISPNEKYKRLIEYGSIIENETLKNGSIIHKENLLISNEPTIQEKKLKEIAKIKNDDRQNIKTYQQKIIDFNNLK